MSNKAKGFKLVLVAALGLPTTLLAAANPVIAPPGGAKPSLSLPRIARSLQDRAIQHVVCFKFVAPSEANPVTLQNLQILGTDGKAVLGRNGQPLVVDENGDTVEGTQENTRTTFTSSDALIAFVKRAYVTEAAKVPYLMAFAGGSNMSHEGTSQARPNGFGLRYDLCFSGVFANANDRDYFVGDDDFPELTDQHHHAFRNLVGPAIAGDATASPPYAGNLLVFDYQRSSDPN